MTRMSPIHHLLLSTLLTVSVAVVVAILAGVDIPRAGAAPPGGPGDRITVVLTSDREFNSAATWFDADNRMRSQVDVPLPWHDPQTKRWSGRLVYTGRVRDLRTDVLFQSSGSFAGCAIWINDRKVAEETSTGRYATVYCAD
ncbi:hypothetical protein QSJ18_10470 [Gordonia sp. ABSL1-1]|uniref:hypothetical protein n=1 Tax=Gordonia sp. ABSL1-1 TaxID=3053923 RepID=UPI0025746C4A|nr:hypothetical protein [Gordonia sp. ABSL1-1]MDL9937167.1 hypothetical protein [Gordonia sp. ABSL1-1]